MLHSISSEKSDVDGEGGTNSYFGGGVTNFGHCCESLEPGVECILSLHALQSYLSDH